jgi:threonine/homoserine/homoserine lactone efflux protein
VELGSWLTIAAVCATGAASPGPSLAVVVKNTVRGGRREGVLTGLGHGIGVGLYAFGAVAGVSAIVASTPGLQRGIELSGAAFLIWMSIQTLRHAGKASMNSSSAAPRGGGGFTEGFLVSFLNPKIAVFFLALLGSFLPVDAGIAERTGVAFLAMGIDAGWYVFAALMLAGSGAADWLGRNGTWVDRTLALMLAGVALFLIFAHSPLLEAR